MTGSAQTAFSRRNFLRGAAWSVPLVGAALAGPCALAAPAGSSGCGEPNELIGNCVAELPEEFSWTSFSTTRAIGGGTSYAIQFTTRITPEVCWSIRWTRPTYGRSTPRFRARYFPARSSKVSRSRACVG